MIQIKNLGVLNAHSALISVYNDLVKHYPKFELITSAFRPGDSGVHGTLKLRGLDLRCRASDLGHVAEDFINGIWSYDPERPSKKVAIFHDVGQGLHLHLQVHPNTRRR